MHCTALPRSAVLCAVMVTLWGSAATPAAARQGGADPVRVLQDTTVVQEIELRDGTKLVGRIVEIDGQRVSFRTLGGLEVELQRQDVSNVRQVRGQHYQGEFWPEDPSDSRLFIGPTARVAGHGRGYVGVYELVVPSFGVGIGRVGMISGGFSALPGIDLEDQVFYIAPKLQVFNAKYVQGAVGLFWAKPGTSEESVGLVYGGVTAGDVRAAFSGGISLPFGSESGFEDDHPLVMLGAELRMTQSLKFITENWILPGDETSIASFGFRIIRNRLTVEVAAAVATSGGGYLPVVNFSTAW
jgi:hypothetical protein